MYSKKEQLRVINLFYQYNGSWSAVVNELGYPSISGLKQWGNDYEINPQGFKAAERRTQKSKYNEQQQNEAVNYYFKHGQRIANTVKMLGYPCRELLRTWVRQDPRFDHKSQVKPPIPKPEIPVNVRMKAIEELYERRDSARNIAKRYNVSRTRPLFLEGGSGG